MQPATQCVPERLRLPGMPPTYPRERFFYSYSFDPSDPAYRHLTGAAAQPLTATVPITVTDHEGNTAQCDLVVKITGVNDPPQISVLRGDRDTCSVTEDAATTTATGTLTAADVDTGDTLTWSVDATTPGTYGSLAVNNRGEWTYTLDNAPPATDSLAAQPPPGPRCRIRTHSRRQTRPRTRRRPSRAHRRTTPPSRLHRCPTRISIRNIMDKWPALRTAAPGRSPSTPVSCGSLSLWRRQRMPAISGLGKRVDDTNLTTVEGASQMISSHRSAAAIYAPGRGRTPDKDFLQTLEITQ